MGNVVCFNFYRELFHDKLYEFEIKQFFNIKFVYTKLSFYPIKKIYKYIHTYIYIININIGNK